MNIILLKLPNLKVIGFVLFLMVAISINSFSSEIFGSIKDSITKEVLISAPIYIKELKIGTNSGLDGSFKLKNISKGHYTIICSYVGYEKQEREIIIINDNSKVNFNFSLKPIAKGINEVVISARKDQSTEISARESELRSPNLMNVMSAKTIELSPDQDVSNVVKRISGVTLEKSSSGSGQYALIRGMDKRYSYTTVNGIEIPSSNNKQRYVSLDIFPSEMVDRIEVSKVLTPDLEGDAIAGVVNIVMKNAPNKFIIQANISEGYSTLWSEHNFLSFDRNAINLVSPYELNGITYYAKPSDFPKSNLDPKETSLPLNTTAGFSIGNRFFKKRLGWILSASNNNIYKGTSSLIFGVEQSTDGNSLPMLTYMQQQLDYNHQQNYGIHNKFDYTISKNHDLQLYTVYMRYCLTQLRDLENTELGNNSYDPANGSKNVTHSNRNRLNIQELFNLTLQGNHSFTRSLILSWNAVYSKATNQSPDNATIAYNKIYINNVLQPQYVDFGGSSRLWLHNTDEDKAGYLNLKYSKEILNGKLELKTGGLYRDKKRNSFYNNYKLIPLGPVDAHTARYVDWINYSDINWTVSNPLGAVNTAGTFIAYENVAAFYGMFQYEKAKLKIIGGARYEDTRQGYDFVFHNAFLDKFMPGNNQKRDHANKYLLPSLNARYAINKHSNLKASYYKAINKPGFLEIVPYNDNTGDYTKTGNPDLRNAVADNYDIRYEYFPNKLDQVLLGVFYKNIIDAIEEGFSTDGHGNYNLSVFNSDAVDYGFEADLIKFLRDFAIKANYTWIYSHTSSFKRSQVNGVVNRDSTVTSLEVRPLFGQPQNVGNLSLLYKGHNNGFNAQIALSYTGERIYKVSPDINGDYWQKAFWLLDFSAEKTMKKGVCIFIKAHNLFNTHVNVYLKQHNSYNDQFPYHNSSDTRTFLRDEYSSPSFLIGIRYKLTNK